MIVVIDPSGRPGATAIARAAAAAGGAVEFVGRVADDPDGDRLLQALAASGVGHVATLRGPAGAAAPLEAPDIDLALRYLSDSTTIVVTDPSDGPSVAAAVDAAGWGRGDLIVVLAAGQVVPDGLPDLAIVLEAPSADPDEAFATLVGTLAARLDAGMDPGAAFSATMADARSWTPVDEGG